MSTKKQEKAIQKIVENGGNISRAMIDAGYSLSTAKTPKKLTGSKGYSDILKSSGLTEGFVVENLVDDIKNKPGKRLGELSLASDLLGLRRRASNINDFDNPEKLGVDFEKGLEYGRIIDQYIKAKIMGKTSFEINIL